MIHAKTLTPNDCVISTRSLGSVKNFEELEARTRGLGERVLSSQRVVLDRKSKYFRTKEGHSSEWNSSFILILSCFSLFPYHLRLRILYFYPYIFTRTSSLGFDTGVTSTFMPRNNSKRRERHRKQQLLAGSIWHWEGSVGLL